MKYLKKFNESYDKSDEFYKDLTDSLFFEINDYFTEGKKRFFPLNVKIGKDTDGSYYGSVCMGPGWGGRMSDEEEDWLFDLLRNYRQQHGVSYDCCADSFSHKYFYERKNAAWPENTIDVINFPKNPFPERLD